MPIEVSAVPIASQFKSLVEACSGQVERAKQTQDAFSKQCPGVRHLRQLFSRKKFSVTIRNWTCWELECVLGSKKVVLGEEKVLARTELRMPLDGGWFSLRIQRNGEDGLEPLRMIEDFKSFSNPVFIVHEARCPKTGDKVMHVEEASEISATRFDLVTKPLLECGMLKAFERLDGSAQCIDEWIEKFDDDEKEKAEKRKNKGRRWGKKGSSSSEDEKKRDDSAERERKSNLKKEGEGGNEKEKTVRFGRASSVSFAGGPTAETFSALPRRRSTGFDSIGEAVEMTPLIFSSSFASSASAASSYPTKSGAAKVTQASASASRTIEAAASALKEKEKSVWEEDDQDSRPMPLSARGKSREIPHWVPSLPPSRSRSVSASSSLNLDNVSLDTRSSGGESAERGDREYPAAWPERAMRHRVDSGSSSCIGTATSNSLSVLVAPHSRPYSSGTRSEGTTSVEDEDRLLYERTNRCLWPDPYTPINERDAPTMVKFMRLPNQPGSLPLLSSVVATSALAGSVDGVFSGLVGAATELRRYRLARQAWMRGEIVKKPSKAHAAERVALSTLVGTAVGTGVAVLTHYGGDALHDLGLMVAGEGSTFTGSALQVVGTNFGPVLMGGLTAVFVGIDGYRLARRQIHPREFGRRALQHIVTGGVMVTSACVMPAVGLPLSIVWAVSDAYFGFTRKAAEKLIPYSRDELYGEAKKRRKEMVKHAYKMLNLPETASELEIRRAYRRLAAACHPDKGGDPAVFRLLSKAYALLQEDFASKGDAATAAALPQRQRRGFVFGLQDRTSSVLSQQSSLVERSNSQLGEDREGGEGTGESRERMPARRRPLALMNALGFRRRMSSCSTVVEGDVEDSASV
uniref:J domain-containing protein n=1 Tax=Chromera velia CCMP2878 TaxID=1169474 RepID=A0A0G4HT32_9ALVE|eukprot:Cvel_8373.t1-p1 / transcript=Cvel_8373.t1 / gene=Cvel_8373 / organism=Chromera_velia_CCMP2878 / gene_product=Chaperone protein dnaJ 2, putative / transcript_product=Chaperone protein dnaJ 2, putative / location=Cvel_scaffold461:39616-43366(+) / protein_length=861 / sequence_SO=supercontig / SO=protein_coding / is_pseudo=false